MDTNGHQFLIDGFLRSYSCEFVFIRGLMFQFLSVTSAESVVRSSSGFFRLTLTRDFTHSISEGRVSLKACHF